MGNTKNRFWCVQPTQPEFEMKIKETLKNLNKQSYLPINIPSRQSTSNDEKVDISYLVDKSFVHSSYQNHNNVLSTTISEGFGRPYATSRVLVHSSVSVMREPGLYDTSMSTSAAFYTEHSFHLSNGHTLYTINNQSERDIGDRPQVVDSVVGQGCDSTSPSRRYLA